MKKFGILMILPLFSALLLTPAHGASKTISGTTLYCNPHYGYASGTDGYFMPQAPLTRADASMMLAKLLAAKPEITVSYEDVPEDAWYVRGAGLMGTMGVMQAGERKFLPEEAVTRSEFVRYVACFFPLQEWEGAFFADVPEDHPDVPYLRSALAYGWVRGTSDGLFHPDVPVTRADAVVMLNRVLGRSPDPEYIGQNQPMFYLDVTPEDWYYHDIIEASVSHVHVEGEDGDEHWLSHTPKSNGLHTGPLSIGGWLYYYDAVNGTLLHDQTVNGFTLDAQGRFTSGSAELDEKLHEIVLEQTDDSMTQEEKLRALYLYTRDSFTYLRRPAYEFEAAGYMQADALDMLNNGYGNCYSYASLFWYLSRWIGYESDIYAGTVGSNKAPHSWVEIAFDGTPYIFDTELEMAYHLKGRTEIDLYKSTGEGTWFYVHGKRANP